MVTAFGRNRAVTVLGMHRSGTSTIMRSFNLLGVYLGETNELVPPYPENPEGFWERWDIYHLQEGLLAALKRTWDTVVPLPERWQDAAEVKPFRDELAALIKRNFSGVPLWGWKDPRSMILFDLWKEILDELCTGLSVVFAVRNPLDVARSLDKRDGIPLDRGMGIWFNYNIAALRSVAHLPKVFLSYDRFLSAWEPELRRCAYALGLDWPQEDSILRGAMNSFIRPDLRHSCSTVDDLQKTGAPRPVLELYGLLLTVLDGDTGVDTVSKTVEDLYGDFCEYSRFYRYDMDAAWGMRNIP